MGDGLTNVARMLLGFAVAASGVGNATASDDPPAGLNRSEWSQIKESIEASSYQANAVSLPGGTPALQAPNRQQAYRTTFRRDGIEITPQGAAASWRLGLSVTGYGYEGDVRPVDPAQPQAEKERVEYRRGLVTEWYVNRPAGLEQGFELQEPRSHRRGPVVVSMAIEGDLAVSAHGHAVSFADRSGGTVVRYAGLKAWDVDGSPLEARIEAGDREVRIVVDAHHARFPVTVDPTFVHEAQLFGHGDGQGGAQFGNSVSVSGDTVVVGAPLNNSLGSFAGSAYVFVRSGTTWSGQQIRASDGGSNDLFGQSVSVSGDTAVIGAPGDTTPGGASAGSAYVFVRSGTTWTQQQKVLASDGATGDFFGISVSVAGDTIVVGANADDTPGGADAGSAYVFVRSGVTWTQQQKVVALDGAANDRFGWSVSVSADTVAVGADLDDTPGGVDAGSAYVFLRSGTTWTQQQKLLASDGGPNDFFGGSVSVSGDTVAVGAVGDGSSVASAYVFVRSGTTWAQQQMLMASDGTPDDLFGHSVSVHGDTVVVGASLADTPGGGNAGAAYVFMRSGTTWTEQQKLLASDGSLGDQLGWSVAVSGNTVVAGANLDDIPNGGDAGAAYVFVRAGTTWTEQGRLLATDGATFDNFGHSVSVSGDVAVVGAPLDDSRGTDTGAAFVFVRSGTTWIEKGKLLAPVGTSSNRLGSSVSVWGETVVAGAEFDNAGAGSAYVFVRSGDTWSLQQRLTASDGEPNDRFGVSVSVFGDTAVIGAYRADGGGAAYVFTRSGTTWAQQQKLQPVAVTGEFGISVSISGDTAVAGARLQNGAGAAYVFTRSGTTWTQQQELTASDGTVDDTFGHSVSISGDTVVVGAPLDDTTGGIDAGSAYMFVRSGTTWSEQQHLRASDGAGADFFGSSVSVSGDAAVVGAWRDTTAAGNFAGSAYWFVRSGATWVEAQKLLAPDAAALDSFGWSVALSGDTAVVGAYLDNALGLQDSGSAHVFRFVPVADTGVTIGDSPDPVPLGANLVYTIVVTNGGPDDSMNVQVALPTPPGLTFVSNAGACTTAFPCAIGTIPAGQTRTITATYHVPLGYGGPNPIVATATAVATSADPNPGNDQATAMTALAAASADLEIVKTGPATVVAGSDVVYIVAVENLGPSDAAGVQVADPTPPGLTFVSNSGACTTPFPCDMATVAAGEIRVITATFNVPAGYGGPNPIVNLATVSAATADPNGANNGDDASTTVTFAANLAPAALAVDSADNGVFQPNETVIVAPSWRNDGAAAVASVEGVASSFTGPAGATYTIVDPTAAYGTIAPGDTAPCADCYGLDNDTATRPTLHWDTTFMESLTPGTATKTWTLHVGDSFDDVPPGSGFYKFIETMLHKDVTSGCAATTYCPGASTTREAMAVFVLVSKDPGGTPPPLCVAGSEAFSDVPASSGFCRWIEELFRRNVVQGCAPGLYCPTSPATREQMAVFVLRTLDPALDPPACVAGSEAFDDVPASSGFCRWIEELARRGVVTGCGNGNYCPTAPVTREQMSVFLSVTFGLTLYGL